MTDITTSRMQAGAARPATRNARSARNARQGIQRISLLAAAMWLAGCTLMPAYDRPAPDMSAHWKYTPQSYMTADGPPTVATEAAGTDGTTGATATAASSADTAARGTGAAASPHAGQGAAPVPAAELGWQQYFADPRLRYLIGLALQHNRDLRLAALNVDAARAQYGIQRADLLPGVGANASMQRTDSARNPAGPSSTYTAQLGVTAFELDFFGRVRSLNNAALNNYLATEQARNAAHIALVAEVARAYIALRVAQQAAELSALTLHARQQSADLVRKRFDAGVLSAIDLHQSQMLIEAARADHAAQSHQAEQASNALAVLIGQPLPADLPPALPLDQQIAIAHLPVGLSADVLLRRPDVQQSEYALKAAHAHIGAARAAFFPRISLTGAWGVSSNELDGLFHGANRLWSFVPQITLPILDWGRNSANLDLAWVRKHSAVAQYEKTIQNAFREVADALSAQHHLRQQLAAQQRSSQADADRLRLVRMRYDNGIASALDRLDAERSSYASQQALLRLQQQYLGSQIMLYKVLGGGLIMGDRPPAGEEPAAALSSTPATPATPAPAQQTQPVHLDKPAAVASTAPAPAAASPTTPAASTAIAAEPANGHPHQTTAPATH